MPITVGDIVTVVLPCRFTDCQGAVVRIVNDDDEDGPIEVEFGVEWKHKGHYWDEDVLLVRFLEEDLRVDSSWNTATLAKRIYGQNFHTVYEFKFPFVFGCGCMIKGCSNRTVMHCMINIWGTVCSLDLCEQCKKEYHGKCGESLPELKRSEEANATT